MIIEKKKLMIIPCNKFVNWQTFTLEGRKEDGSEAAIHLSHSLSVYIYKCSSNIDVIQCKKYLLYLYLDI